MIKFLYSISKLPERPQLDNTEQLLSNLYYDMNVHDKESGDKFVESAKSILGEPGRSRAEHMLLLNTLTGSLFVKERNWKLEYKKKSKWYYRAINYVAKVI